MDKEKSKKIYTEDLLNVIVYTGCNIKTTGPDVTYSPVDPF